MDTNKGTPTRVLHVIHGGTLGGIESLMFNYYNGIDKQKYQFDFIFHSQTEIPYYAEIRKQGGKIFYCPPLGENPIKYFKTLRKILEQDQKYKIIHIHTGFQTGFVAFIAWMSGIKIRICHSHNVELESVIYQKLFVLWRLLIKICCNKYFACSYKSGEIWYKNNEFKFIPNAVDFARLKKAKMDVVSQIRSNFGIKHNQLVIAHAGRFVPVKNHIFLINIMERFKDREMLDIHLILAGEGPLYNDIEMLVQNKGLENNVHFLGNINNMSEFWYSCDIMILPSYNEGFSNVFVEAQVCGKYSLLSSKVDAVDNMGFVNYDKCSLDNIDEWIEKILEYKCDNKVKFGGYPELENSRFNISIAAKDLENLYDSYL